MYDDPNLPLIRFAYGESTTGLQRATNEPAFLLETSGAVVPLHDWISHYPALLSLPDEIERLGEFGFSISARETLELCHVGVNRVCHYPEETVTPICSEIHLFVAAEGIQLVLGEAVFATLGPDGWTSSACDRPSQIVLGSAAYFAPPFALIKQTPENRARVSSLAERKLVLR